jgi:hypothetical protein
MTVLRIIGTTLAAALCSAALMVGAALAEGPDPAPSAGKPKPPAGLCLLHDR